VKYPPKITSTQWHVQAPTNGSAAISIALAVLVACGDGRARAPDATPATDGRVVDGVGYDAVPDAEVLAELG
jgi:hypothetical protein